MTQRFKMNTALAETQVRFLVPVSGSTQQTVTPAPVGLNALFWSLWESTCTWYPLLHTQAHIYT